MRRSTAEPTPDRSISCGQPSIALVDFSQLNDNIVMLSEMQHESQLKTQDHQKETPIDIKSSFNLVPRNEDSFRLRN